VKAQISIRRTEIGRKLFKTKRRKISNRYIEPRVAEWRFHHFQKMESLSARSGDSGRPLDGRQSPIAIGGKPV
jgi:hypothetical protein